MSPAPHTNLKAWVVFSGHADMWWLRILRPGFRHCALLLHDGLHWIGVDPLSSMMEITVHNIPPQVNLAQWMREQGHVVVEVTPQSVHRAAPWGVFSCVEIAKRVLGIHHRFILTPWQLYRHIAKTQSLSATTNIEGEFIWEA
ncbi:MAG: hypothetical protein IT559_07005 [Alphaproteobacteria bacterium]|nr:hypothetical protein [Alphaproteobacteria bacterium]